MSTSSSSSSEEESQGGGGGGGGGGGMEGPSSSRRRMRSSNGFWPEPFIEALALQVAIDASSTIGRLAAAQALFNIFQVCSMWRAISRSELLWQNVTRHVWNVTQRVRNTWHEEYIYRHRTATNFRHHRYEHHTPPFVPADRNNVDSLSCRRLALSDSHLAAGFSDGSVHLFHLPTRFYVTTYYPLPRDRIGRFSLAISGILLSDTRLVFATLDGDVHVAVINPASPLRRAVVGDVVTDGVLIDFTGCDQWWVGLYAGSPGRAFHVWNSETEELVFVGGVFTDPQAVMGWHLLNELTELIGRVRVTSPGTAVACTSNGVIVLDLTIEGMVVHEQEFPGGIIVGCFDTNSESMIIVDSQATAGVHRVDSLEEVCGFAVRGASQRGVLGCVNGGYGFVCGGGVIRVWDIQNGEYLYRFRERIGMCSALIANERHVAACSSDATIHLWDFGAQ